MKRVDDSWRESGMAIDVLNEDGIIQGANRHEDVFLGKACVMRSFVWSLWNTTLFLKYPTGIEEGCWLLAGTVSFPLA